MKKSVNSESINRNFSHSTKMITKFPPPPNTRNPVLMMSLDDFFGVGRQDLLSYPLHDFNVFVDDAQSYQRYQQPVFIRTHSIHFVFIYSKSSSFSKNSDSCKKNHRKNSTQGLNMKINVPMRK